VVTADSATVLTGDSVTHQVLRNDSDANQDALSVVGPLVVNPSSAGTASTNGSTITFTAGASTAPGSVTIGYRVSDGIATVPATPTVTVRNRVPVARPDERTLDLNVASSLTANVLSNDGDAEGPVRLIGATVAAGSGDL